MADQTIKVTSITVTVGGVIPTRQYENIKIETVISATVEDGANVEVAYNRLYELARDLTAKQVATMGNSAGQKWAMSILPEWGLSNDR